MWPNATQEARAQLTSFSLKLSINGLGSFPCAQQLHWSAHNSTEWLPPSGARKVPTVPEMMSHSDQCLTEVTLATLLVPTGHTDTMAPDVKKMQTQLA